MLEALIEKLVVETTGSRGRGRSKKERRKLRVTPHRDTM